MKKILFFAAALLTMSLGFTACSDDDGEYSSYNMAEDAGAAVAKSYTGTWTRTLGDEVITSTGTVTLEGTDKKNIVKVTIAANNDVALEQSTFNANITQKSETLFAITLPVTDAFTTQTGLRIMIDNGAITAFDFIKMVRVGRKSYEYYYNFVGQ